MVSATVVIVAAYQPNHPNPSSGQNVFTSPWLRVGCLPIWNLEACEVEISVTNSPYIRGLRRKNLGFTEESERHPTATWQLLDLLKSAGVTR